MKHDYILCIHFMYPIAPALDYKADNNILSGQVVDIGSNSGRT